MTVVNSTVIISSSLDIQYFFMIELLTGNLAEKSTEILKIGFSIWVGFNVTLIITFLLLRINKRDTQVVEMHLQIINAMAAIIIFSLLSYNIISQ